jgi:hypothetical protein
MPKSVQRFSAKYRDSQKAKKKARHPWAPRLFFTIRKA